MKLLLTGATGFVGRPLVQQLVAAGHECVVVSRHPKAATGLPPGVRAYSYEDEWPLVDGVINLAGESVVGLWTGRKRAAIINSRVHVTRRLVDWMSQLSQRPRVFLSGSAVGYYGHRPGEILTETSPPDPSCQFRCQVCRAWEGEAHQAKELGVRVVTLRLGNILHPSGGYLGKLIPWYRYGLGPILGDAQAMLSWISLEDAFRLIFFALEQADLSGPLNVTTPYPVSQAEFAQLLAGRFGKRAWGRAPSFLMKLALGKFSAALLDSQAIQPAKALDHGFQFSYPDLESYFTAVIRK